MAGAHAGWFERTVLRPRVVGVLAVVVTLLAGVSLFDALVTPTEVDPDDALASFRAQQEAAADGAGVPTTAPQGDPSSDDLTADGDAAPGGDATDDEPGEATPTEATPTEEARPTNGGEVAPEEPDPAPSTDPDPEPDPGSEAGPEPEPEPAPRFQRPAQGVYSFSVDGQESLDVPGGSREYPENATGTLIHTDATCGWQATIALAEEHEDEYEFCSDADAVSMRRVEQFVEFLGVGDRQSFVCPDPIRVSGEPGGPAVTGRCSDARAGADAEITVRVVEAGGRTVGGVTVDALRIDYTVVFSGANEGTTEIVTWVEAASGLLLFMEREGDLMVETDVGRRRYQEQVVVELLDLTPRT